jgi:hypothetical protein
LRLLRLQAESGAGQNPRLIHVLDFRSDSVSSVEAYACLHLRDSLIDQVERLSAMPALVLGRVLKVLPCLLEVVECALHCGLIGQGRGRGNRSDSEGSGHALEARTSGHLFFQSHLLSDKYCASINATSGVDGQFTIRLLQIQFFFHERFVYFLLR